ncbi:cupin domain-containing protein [Chitiniphilus shinanonensis]|uniref:cupin domain-containing protein n=1 Tax=Chitiniphilus shinanonensis TaxID=553088 RepID=UPI003056614D
MIHIERHIDDARQRELGVAQWPVWSKEVSRFPWHYDETETCWLIAGRVRVTAADGESVTLEAGDLARFPAGLDCTWEVLEPLSKHYRFG